MHPKCPWLFFLFLWLFSTSILTLFVYANIFDWLRRLSTKFSTPKARNLSLSVVHRFGIACWELIVSLYWKCYWKAPKLLFTKSVHSRRPMLFKKRFFIIYLLTLSPALMKERCAWLARIYSHEIISAILHAGFIRLALFCDFAILFPVYRRRVMFNNHTYFS